MEHSFIRIAQEVDTIICILDDLLSLDYLSFDIELDNRVYSFYNPTTPKEADQLQSDRKEVISILLKDALNTLISTLIDREADPQNDEELFALIQRPFIRLLHLHALYFPKERIQSPIATESYEVVKQDAKDKAKPLDLDSWHVQNENPKNWQE